jgi:1-acyl-sn-glycerol-3-phosphate acyltransferase
MISRKLKLIIRIVYNLYCYFFAIFLLTFFISWFIAAPFLSLRGRRVFLFNIINLYVQTLFLLIFIRIKKEGTFKKGQYIYIANHTSYLDVLVALRILKNRSDLYFSGRADLCKIPVFGFFYKQVAVPVDRDSLMDRVNNLQALDEKLKAGNSLFIFPEATFNSSENLLLPFKKGAFKLSFDNKIDILPLVFFDGKKRMNDNYKFSLTPGKFRVRILKPFNTLAYNSHDELRKACMFAFEREMSCGG